MPKARHSRSVEYSLAARLVGGERALEAGVHPRTSADWRTDGKVPAYRVLDLLLSRVGDEARLSHSAAADRSISDLLRGAMDTLDRSAYEFFIEVLKHRKDTMTTEWSLISHVILGTLRMYRKTHMEGPSGERQFLSDDGD